MTRACIFCQGTAGSAEHLFPNWLNQLFPVTPSDSPVELARHQASETGVATNTWTAQEIASVTTKLVCHNCNTGWMSRLESRAKPVLTPLIQGQGGGLTLDDQLLIATWATKTAMAFEPTLTSLDCFSADECGIVRLQDRPPASVEVVLAAVEGVIQPMHYSATKVRAVAASSMETVERIHIHTVQVGALVMQVVRHDPPQPGSGSLVGGAVPREIALGADVGLVVFPPREAARWPPFRILTWDELLKISTRGVAMEETWEIPDEVMRPGGAPTAAADSDENLSSRN